MTDCCQDKACELDALRIRQAATLKTVLALNATMFVVELAAGLAAGSVSLLADSLDMLGDTLVYGVSLYVVDRGLRSKAKAAFIKGIAMAVFGLFVLAQAGYRVCHPQMPEFSLMAGIGLLALICNMTCLWLLWRHRSDDINMRSVWLCSRNDIIANVSVLVAAGLGWWVQSPWPDLAVGVALAALFLKSAASVLREASTQLRTVQV
jgi:cation diffusion facilitator family transporter